MTDDLERRLRHEMPAARLPSAPDALRERLRTVVLTDAAATERADHRRVGRVRLVLAVAAIVLVGGLVAIAIGSRRPDILTTVDGLPVMTVSEALAAHAAVQLPGGQVAVRGWWSDGEVGHSCVPSMEPVGELELRCIDGEYGIAERNEPMFVVDMSSGVVTYEAQGPHLTPFISESVDRIEDLFGLPIINGQRYPPVPIVVRGHFDDPRAAQCLATAHQLCLARLALDRVVQFDPGSVPTPAVTAEPTAFPDPPPAALFDASACAGDVPYSFVGWTTTAALELPYERPGHVYAMVTRDAVVLTADGWADDPNGSGHKFQMWGQKICIAEEGPGHEGEMGFGNVPGSAYVLWDDGLKVPGDNPQRP